MIGLMLAAVAGVLIAGYVIIFVLPPRQLVVRVNDVKYTRGDMVKLLRVRQRNTELAGGRMQLSVDIFQALQLIVENEIISQSAPKYGITVSDEEVEDQIRASFTPRSTGQEDPAQLEREFQESYKSFLNSVRLSDKEYRELLRKSILREKFRQFIGESVPYVAEQVHLYRLVMAPDDEIEIMRIKFRDGTPFKELVREFSRDDPETIRKGGDLGWVPRGIYPDYDHVIFSLEPGELSDPVQDLDDPRRLLFFMVSERQEARELEPEDREVLKTRALQDWLNEERKKNDVYAVFNSDIYDWMVKQLRIAKRVPDPTPTPNPFREALGF